MDLEFLVLGFLLVGISKLTDTKRSSHRCSNYYRYHLDAVPPNHIHPPENRGRLKHTYLQIPRIISKAISESYSLTLTNRHTSYFNRKLFTIILKLFRSDLISATFCLLAYYSPVLNYDLQKGERRAAQKQISRRLIQRR